MFWGFLWIVMFLPACAVLQHVQVSDIDGSRAYRSDRFEIQVNQTGLDVEEASDLIKAISTSKKGDETADKIANFISLFQQGPSTGNGVFSDRYAEDIITRIHEQCPSGRISGLMSIRETIKYPVLSSEIIRITGYCLNKKS